MSTPAGRPAPGGLAASGLVALDEDHHVHSTFSDDAVSTVAENVRAARKRGLRVARASPTTCAGAHAWVPDFVAAVRELRPVPDLEVLAGVEAKILDSAGELDLPPSLRGIDLVLIADHQYPGDHGPVPPEDMRDGLERRPVTRRPTSSTASSRPPWAPWSGRRRRSSPTCSACCPRWAWTRRWCPAPPLDHLAQGCYQAGARVELNEKWACPSPRTIRALSAAGVPLVAGTDSHDCATVGRYARVQEILAAVPSATAVP